MLSATLTQPRRLSTGPSGSGAWRRRRVRRAGGVRSAPSRRPVTVCHGAGIAQIRPLSASAAPSEDMSIPTHRRASTSPRRASSSAISAAAVTARAAAAGRVVRYAGGPPTGTRSDYRLYRRSVGGLQGRAAGADNRSVHTRTARTLARSNSTNTTTRGAT